MNIKLLLLDKQLKTFLVVYLIIITIGVSIGLIYLSQTTSLTPNGTVERFNGSQVDADKFEIPDSFPKPMSELLVSTHNHIIGLSFIFFTVGLIFYFNSIVKGILKSLLMIEPLISIIVTFGSIWLMRFADPDFVYLTFISSFFMYAGFYIVVMMSLYELVFIHQSRVELEAKSKL